MNNNFTNVVSKAFEAEAQKIVNEIKKTMPQRMMAIKSEIANDYRQIVKSVFKSVFDNYYGEDYDYDSLMSSLTFYSGSKLYPEFMYDIDHFRFLNKLEKSKRKFNQNSSSQSSIKEFRDPSMVTLEYASNFFNELDDYSESGFIIDDQAQWEEAQEFALDFWNFTPQNNNKRLYALSPVEEVYRIAKERAVQEFQKQYTSQIKPRILKKYGIKLG